MSKLKLIICIGLIGLSTACSRYNEQQVAELNRGKEVYIANCLSCHGSDGNGLGGAYPGLVKESITSDYTARARYLIENGSPGQGGMMPVPITQKEITEVINYIQNSWGNQADFQVFQTTTQLSNK